MTAGAAETVFTHRCGYCGASLSATDGNWEELAAAWHESIEIDLCPACRKTARGKRQMERDRKLAEKARTGYEKRLTRTLNSH